MKKRHTIFILLAVCFLAEAAAQQKISLKMSKQPVESVLRQIEEQSEYTFSYNPVLLKDFPPVTVDMENASLSDVLDAVFGKSRVQYVIRGKHIILKERPKNITISGFIYENGSRESLIAANVFDALSQKGAVSNHFGFYSLSLPPHSVRLRASYVGYAPLEMDFVAENDTVIHFFLDAVPQLNEVVVEGRQTAPLHTAETGKITLNTQTLQALPSFLGEKDVIKSLQLMPGVAAGTEGVAGMYVRGGNVDENLYLVDGNPLYHVSHFGGIFSAFNPEAVKTMDFYKGSFPARYGGRLSSVVDVRMNDGNVEKFGGTASIGLISSRFNFQGPIAKGKTSFNVSLRRTYLDLIARPIFYFAGRKSQKDSPETYEKPNVGYFFYDFNAKISHKFSDRSRLFLSVYDGKDKLYFKMNAIRTHALNPNSWETDGRTRTSETVTDFRMKWGTRMASLNWAYVINSKLFANTTLIYGNYASDINAENTEKEKIMQPEGHAQRTSVFGKTTYRSGIEDIGFRMELSYTPVHNHYVRFGTSFLHHNFRPEESGLMWVGENNAEKQTDTITFANERIKVRELSLYAEDEINLGTRLRVNVGVHLSGFFVQGKPYISAQPRMAARYLINERWSAKASYGKMNQYVHLLQSSYISLPNDLWVPITKNIKPMISHQVTGGIFGRWRGFDLSLEGYYKASKNQVEYREGAHLLAGNLNWEQRVAQGLSQSYGVEAMANKTFGNTSGWLGYTLSWSDRRFPNGEINRGRAYPAKYDNRHKINAVVLHKFNRKFDASASWVYATGNWTTLPLQKYLDDNGTEQNYVERRNNFKMPAYHRLDLSFNFYRHKKRGRTAIWNVSIYNVYLNHNSFLVIPKKETIQEKSGDGGLLVRSEKTVVKSISIFPILPSFSYTYKF